jgi:DNA-binding transcriptional MerR regulator
MPRKRLERLPLPGYSFADVLVLTTATRSQLQYWTREGVVTASHAETAGTGIHRRFSTFNLIEIQVCASLARYRVSLDVLRGALNAFRSFHRGAVGLYESGVAKLPFEPEPWRVALFPDAAARKSAGERFLNAVAGWFLTVQAPHQHFVRSAETWAALRASSLIRGIPDTFSVEHFAGLVVAEDYGDVVLDRENLAAAVESSAIIVNVADVVFRVGEHARRLGVTLEPW